MQQTESSIHQECGHPWADHHDYEGCCFGDCECTVPASVRDDPEGADAVSTEPRMRAASDDDEAKAEAAVAARDAESRQATEDYNRWREEQAMARERRE